VFDVTVTVTVQSLILTNPNGAPTSLSMCAEKTMGRWEIRKQKWVHSLEKVAQQLLPPLPMVSSILARACFLYGGPRLYSWTFVESLSSYSCIISFAFHLENFNFQPTLSLLFLIPIFPFRIINLSRIY
jgi:hypothetical protein